MCILLSYDFSKRAADVGSESIFSDLVVGIGEKV